MKISKLALSTLVAGGFLTIPFVSPASATNDPKVYVCHWANGNPHVIHINASGLNGHFDGVFPNLTPKQVPGHVFDQFLGVTLSDEEEEGCENQEVPEVPGPVGPQGPAGPAGENGLTPIMFCLGDNTGSFTSLFTEEEENDLLEEFPNAFRLGFYDDTNDEVENPTWHVCTPPAGKNGTNGSDGKDSTVIGPVGPSGENGKDSTVVGPAGKDGLSVTYIACSDGTVIGLGSVCPVGSIPVQTTVTTSPAKPLEPASGTLPHTGVNGWLWMLGAALVAGGGGIWYAGSRFSSRP